MRPRLYALVLACAISCQAEKLPLKIYTAAEGLAHNSLNRIVRDSRGYLWFCTSEGLSRFDGYEFHNFGRRDGLPHRIVNDVLETRRGELWIATAGGLCQYAPKGSGRSRFRVYRVGNDERTSYSERAARRQPGPRVVRDGRGFVPVGAPCRAHRTCVQRASIWGCRRRLGTIKSSPGCCRIGVGICGSASGSGLYRSARRRKG